MADKFREKPCGRTHPHSPHTWYDNAYDQGGAASHWVKQCHGFGTPPSTGQQMVADPAFPPPATEPPKPPIWITPDEALHREHNLTAKQQIRAQALAAAAVAWNTPSTAQFDPSNLPPTVLMTARQFASYIESGD